MLDAKMKTQLEAYLQNLKTPVELVAYLDGQDKSRELETLMNEVAALSPLVSLVQGEDHEARRPAMGVRSVASGTEMRFAGVPLGHEFTSLVLAVLHSGGHPMKIDKELIEQVRNLDGEYRFETYISLSCQTCPEVVQALNMMAAINPQIRNEMIDGAMFQDEVEARKVLAVPSVFMNGQQFSQGRISLADILKKMDKNAGARSLKKLAEKGIFDMLVVGGGPAGASAAIYAARKGIRTGVLADKFGGQLLDTVSIENFISVNETEGPKLVANLEAHVGAYDVDIMAGHQASGLSVADDGSIEISVEGGAVLRSRSVLLATGARWREMKVPGEQEYRGKGVAYCPHCDGPLFKGKSVAVIGGGNSGIEAAIDLAGITGHVTVLEFDSKLRADEVLQRKARSLKNVDIITSAQTTEVLGDGDRVIGLAYTDRQSGETKTISLAGIFVQIGLVPNTEFLKGVVDLSPRGEIEIGARGETSVPGVFAAGDVTTTPFKQIVIAVGSGATAALGAFDYLIRQPVLENSAEQIANQAA
ncbi:alkyl hydroperoxide reductase subunit F [Zhongshania sp.]|uniref:alkyl hydroperoxide reductase subunit F n=1 Tax=Zhongshania sp. TaxID=1971902 RepID=UPI00356A6BED